MILVTGAYGFVGRHLLERFSQDQKFTKVFLRSRPETLPSIVSEVCVGTIDGKTDWRSPLEGVTEVVHLAARAHILRDDAADPEAEFRRVNVEGTLNLARQCAQAGVKHFVFVSSVGAIATLSDRALNETSPCSPDTPYGRSKLRAEDGLKAIAQASGMTYTILRPTLVYGPGNPGNMERLMKLVRLGLPLPLGSIRNLRSFVYVENLVDAILCCLEHPEARNQTFVVSDGQDVSTPQLIQKIAQSAGYPCRLFPCPVAVLQLLGRAGSLLQRATGRTLPINQDVVERLSGSLVVDSAKIRTTLDWQPPFSLEEGLIKTFRS
ncbi:NAD-dependent epimerase/dehydratase family protein [Geitlerinema sp. PCC 7407]|uniref:NAD-dependent epimerase/dehydratase family protein n=1 Tax=Geitlerinema sp. PCC 7407 TaxID=1173025 RepID=UPI00029FA7CE|nr:NAD-dependent epimerase/dehydratase family protein [Geitlerinema sp. PCC 7407]AFY66781.1 NAD-dependent epimerase/dehydratase [Geitlerinema sp. PCC 7407]